MRLASSFRDPHGFVFRREGVIYRQVNEPHARHLEMFVESGLYEALVDEGLLVPHEAVTIDLAPEPGAIAVLRPREVPFVSYPYEWGFLQLRDAALLTLRIQELALGHGMSLRDASAYNVTFDGSHPVFIDATSFEVLPDGRPWVAYRQFCEHFLAPLALMAFRDVRLGQLSRVWMDGIPLDLATDLLPAKMSVRPGLAMHLRLHARAQRRHRGTMDADVRADAAGRFSLQAFRGLVASLRKAVEGMTEPDGVSVWRDYYRDARHYPDAAAAAKERFVASALAEIAPATVWDLGANTGHFARMATASSARAVAFDLDAFCVDEAYRVARSTGDGLLLPLVLDFANPSPAIGWDNRERDTLHDRGSADLVFALALVHHLGIGNNLPLLSVVDFIARCGSHAIVEWVPEDDPMTSVLLHGRDELLASYSYEAFRAAVDAHFRELRREQLPGSNRVMFLLERR